MTDRMAALATLSLHDVPQRENALADFYNRYAGDALVVDKWFSLQATIPHRDTLSHVRALTTHPAFSLANPNRVRSLIGAFAQGNTTQFNRPDGGGYEFIADTVLALDQKNPQVSARLATAFRNWRTMEHGRQTKAEGALRRIRAESLLSRDLSDIVDRALAAP
jgi:aminopeptidase N